MVATFTQWSTIKPYVSAFPAWTGTENAERIASYQLYEEMYWNVPDTFKVIQRGADTKPIYVPSSRQIIETMHRYLAPGFQVIADPSAGTEGERAEATRVIKDFLRRESFLSKFSSNKRYGLIRGDWLFHIYADSTLPEGSRISIEPIDPGSYFPIYAEDEMTIIGCHIVDHVVDERGEQFIFRQTYRKESGAGGPSRISHESAVFEVDAWGGPGQEKEVKTSTVDAKTILPDPITAIPVYHITNAEEPSAPWGSSELRGLERMIAAINQSISDEEIELVLNGLGVYVTDSGAPKDEETGEDLPWNLGPAKVIELPTGKKFERVSGTTDVQPHQDHLKYLHEQLDITVGASPAAKGNIDVAANISGIALRLQLAPIFARAEEKELIITDKMTQLLYDLKNWFIAIESVDIGDAVWIPSYGPRLPLNETERFEQIMKMLEAKVVSASWARRELTKLGFVFDSDDEMSSAILADETALAQVQADVTGARMDALLSGGAGNA